MKIRRYMGKDIQEVMLKVKMDLGSDAIILNTRKIKQKGFLNLFSKPLTEVLAAVDEAVMQSTTNSTSVKNTSDKRISKAADRETMINSSEKYKEQQIENEKIHALESKVNNIEGLLQKMYLDMKLQNKEVQSNDQPDSVSKVIQVFENNLLENNVDKTIVVEIMEKVKATVTNQTSINEVAAKMYNLISELLEKPKTIEMENDNEAKVAIFVGPTGVGKTTTLAKLAAIFSINHKKNIGIITSDTYRIAAVEQLKTYTEILGLPIHVVYSPDEIGEAVKKFSDKDLILIDTAGRSHKDEKQFEELKRIIELGNPDEVFLLVSSTTDYKVCKEIVDGYSFIKDYKIIITKMDEAANHGIIMNIKKLTNKSLSYITVGQSVPDDIEVVNTEMIAKKLIGSMKL